MANTYGSIPTASFPGVDADRDHVHFTSLRQMRELIKPISSFIRPSTFGESTARIKHNLYLRATYAMFVLLTIYLSFVLHPDLLIIRFCIGSWVLLLLYFCHKGSFVVFIRTSNDRIVLGVLGVLTILLFLPFGVWLKVLVSILIGFVIVVIHTRRV